MAKVLSMFPGAQRTHRLYLFGRSDGSIKIGRTRNPAQRLRMHFWKSGNSIQWAHLFPQSHSGDCEEMLKDCLCYMARRVGRSETYRGITKARAITLCRAAISGGPVALLEIIRERDAHLAEPFARKWA